MSNGSVVSYYISIHALVKRATILPCPVRCCALNFNPRPREEGDNSGVKSTTKYSISIHALVKRATWYKYHFIGEYDISIHALVKRATPALIDLLDEVEISIHALVKRATEGDDWKHPYDIISIHALVKRATSRFYRLFFFRNNFNPRPREEGDLVAQNM